MNLPPPATPPATTRRIYNPGWLSDDDLIAGFVARQDLFEFLRGDLVRAPLHGNVQHYLLVGVRGAGKTTMLRRLAAAVRRDPRLSHLIALSFPEELYHVKGLADLWWSACDALCDELAQLGRHTEAAALEAEVERQRPRGVQADAHDGAGLRLLLDTCARLQRRPVLLIDNLDLVMQRIDKNGRKLKDPLSPAFWALRETLSRPDTPVVVGGSVRLSEPFVGYDKAFYEFFSTKLLAKLSLAECKRVLLHLARSQGVPDLEVRLGAQRGRVRALYELTGGNPRALGLIFEVLRQGASARAVDDFEQLIDLSTPYYKHRIEDLSEQAQVILSAMATRRPSVSVSGARRFGLTAAQIAEEAGLDTRTVSAQLDVLIDEGVAEKSGGKGRMQYRIAEQLFRLWLQMRGTRRVRAQVLGLAEYLQALFDHDELPSVLRSLSLMPDFSEPLARARNEFLRGELEAEPSNRRALLASAADAVAEHSRRSGLPLQEFVARQDLPRELFDALALRERLNASLLAAGLAPARREAMGDALVGSLTLDTNLLRQSWPALDDPAQRLAQIERLDQAIAEEQRRLQDLGLTAPQIDWLHRQRARALLPLPELLPQDLNPFEASADTADAVAVVWALLIGEGRWVALAKAESASAWFAWCEAHAAGIDSPPWALLARRLRAEGHAALADAAFVRAAAAVESTEYQLEAGERHWEALQVQLAHDAFSRAVALAPASSYAWARLAHVLHVGLGHHGEAEAAYRRAIELEPADAHLWTQLAYLLTHDMKRHADAEAAYRKAVELDPTNAYAWRALGDLLTDHLGRHAVAETALRRAIEVEPDSPTAWNSLGVLLADQLDRPEEAEGAYRRAIELDPTFVYAISNLGDLQRRDLKRYDEAELAYRKAIDIDPRFANAWSGLGNLLTWQLRQHDDAEAAFRTAVELNPRHASAWAGLAQLLAEHRHAYAEAVSALDRAIELQPSAADACAPYRADWQMGVRLEAVHQATRQGAWSEAMRLLAVLITEGAPPAAFVGKTMVERFVGVAWRGGQGAPLLAALREAGFERVAMPLVLALDAAIEGGKEKLESSEPELQAAALKLFERVTSGAEG